MIVKAPVGFPVPDPSINAAVHRRHLTSLFSPHLTEICGSVAAAGSPIYSIFTVSFWFVEIAKLASSHHR